ncbi:hypothetical protein [Massilia arenae]|uniref:Lipoprotein n=1 Tax=Massilia arenae TaxID=2603288 RepID=A0A5C7FUB1_9BURK|nr:hypothetical protein [Massilia arenae]TXF99538.1 hypothetical protein FVD38_11990 [Massilia arenae]
MKTLHLSSLAGLCLLMPLAFAQACPGQVPPGLTAVPVASKAVVNGLSMAINQVQGPGTASSVLDRVEQQWKQGGFDVRRGNAMGWDTVSAMGKGCLVTLQLVNRNGVFGYLARSTPHSGAAASPAAMGVPLPPDARVASSVASDDDGRKGLVVTMSSQRTLDQLGEFFMRQLGDQGWNGLRSHQIVNPANGVASLLVNARRGRGQVELMMWREGGTQIVMTISEAL